MSVIYCNIDRKLFREISIFKKINTFREEHIPYRGNAEMKSYFNPFKDCSLVKFFDLIKFSFHLIQSKLCVVRLERLFIEFLEHFLKICQFNKISL